MGGLRNPICLDWRLFAFLAAILSGKSMVYATTNPTLSTSTTNPTEHSASPSALPSTISPTTVSPSSCSPIIHFPTGGPTRFPTVFPTPHPTPIRRKFLRFFNARAEAYRRYQKGWSCEENRGTTILTVAECLKAAVAMGLQTHRKYSSIAQSDIPFGCIWANPKSESCLSDESRGGLVYNYGPPFVTPIPCGSENSNYVFDCICSGFGTSSPSRSPTENPTLTSSPSINPVTNTGTPLTLAPTASNSPSTTCPSIVFGVSSRFPTPYPTTWGAVGIEYADINFADAYLLFTTGSSCEDNGAHTIKDEALCEIAASHIMNGTTYTANRDLYHERPYGCSLGFARHAGLPMTGPALNLRTGCLPFVGTPCGNGEPYDTYYACVCLFKETLYPTFVGGTFHPTYQPTRYPTPLPSLSPTNNPTYCPTVSPPTRFPTKRPTLFVRRSIYPSASPISSAPTTTSCPTGSYAITNSPTTVAPNYIKHNSLKSIGYTCESWDYLTISRLRDCVAAVKNLGISYDFVVEGTDFGCTEAPYGCSLRTPSANSLIDLGLTTFNHGQTYIHFNHEVNNPNCAYERSFVRPGGGRVACGGETDDYKYDCVCEMFGTKPPTPPKRDDYPTYKPTRYPTPVPTPSPTKRPTRFPTSIADMSIRLVNGTEPWNGRVELKYHGVWGTVCDEEFENVDAQVACSSLGFKGGIAIGGAFYGVGTIKIVVRKMRCSGHESYLQHCRAAWNTRGAFCSHFEDASVQCDAPTSSPVSLAPTFSPTTTHAHYPHGHVPHVHNGRTYAPTSSPITQSPTYTRHPSMTPSTSPLTSTPVTIAPSRSPMTCHPTSSPISLNPTARTISPSISPIIIGWLTLAPTYTKNPLTTCPTATKSPSGSPVTIQPTDKSLSWVPTTLTPTESLTPTTTSPTHVPTLTPVTCAPTFTLTPTNGPLPIPTVSSSPSTESPRTYNPTSVAPSWTTSSPTSLSPTTLSPLTHTPTSASPASIAPTTFAPTLGPVEESVIYAWGSREAGGFLTKNLTSQFNLGGGPEVIYAQAYGFFAINRDHSIYSWGDPNFQDHWNIPSKYHEDIMWSNVVNVTANQHGTAVLLTGGKVRTWGLFNHIEIEANLSSGIKEVVASNGAFAALYTSGDVFTWGNKTQSYVGDPSQLSSVTKLASTSGAFAALKSDGSVYSWGEADSGGTIDTSLSSKLSSGIVDIIPTTSYQENYGSFTAIKSDHGTFLRAIVFGNIVSGGGQISGLDNYGLDIVSITASDLSFAAIKKDGTIASWGWDTHGGSLPSSLSSTTVTKIVPCWGGFGAITSAGSVVCWGYGGCGTTCATHSSETNVVDLVTNGWAITAIRSDGTAFAWGDSDLGGTVPIDVQAYLDRGVKSIIPTKFAFAAIVNDTNIVTWGNKYCGGEIPNIARPITKGQVQKIIAGAVDHTLPECGSFVMTRWAYTQSPTSCSPSTISPSTCGPSTCNPTSLSPSSTSPSTYNPTTFGPTTFGPITTNPTNEPTTCSPSSFSPTTRSPSTGPTSLSPASSSPTSCSPSSCRPTSCSPSSSRPTSCSPSTCSPSSGSPTSCSPTTCAPTSCGPTSCSPSTCSPSSRCPTSCFPSTIPTTCNPSSLSPSSCSPSSCSPSTFSPTSTTVQPSVSPASLSPRTFSPSSCHPTSGHPTSGHPTSQSPTTCHPTSGHPTSGHPTSQSPTTCHPTSGHPTSGHPTSQSPTTCHPTSGHPTSQSPTSGSPSTIPTTCNPSSLSPSSCSPSTFSPTSTTAQPSVSPASLSPRTLSPSSCHPTSGHPTSGRPTSQSPTTFHPTSGHPTSGRPTSQSPTTCHPTSGHPTSGQPSQSPTTCHPTSGSPSTIPTTCNPSSLSPSSCSPSTFSPTSTTAQPSVSPASLSPRTLSPSSCHPTSGHPTSGRPTSQSPTTCHPTSGHPTSGHPTSQSPTTCHPTSGHPTSMHPTSMSPSTCGPSTSAPSSVNPTSLSPSTRVPSSGSPSSFNPTSLTPSTRVPSSGSPSSFNPTSLSPSTRVPSSGSPSSFNPTSLSPSTRVPSSGSPSSFNPTSLSPSTRVPSSGSPSSCNPTSLSPSTGVPSSGSPSSCSPTSLSPSTFTPNTRHPATDHPTSMHPTTSSPDTSHPTSAHPTTIQPTSMSPSTQLPTTVSPSTRHPTSGTPTTGSPTSLGPTSCSPSTSSPTSFGPTSLSPSTVNPSTFLPSQTPTTSAPSLSPVTEVPATTAPSYSAPVPKQAIFSNLFTSIYVLFDKESDTPSLTCSELVGQNITLLGTDPTCLWAKDDTFEIRLGSGFTIRINDTIAIIGGKVKVKDHFSEFNPTLTIQVEAPNTDFNPVGVIVGDSLVGSCDNLTLDAGQSTGGAGRLLGFNWSYSGSDNTILMLLSINKSKITIPNSLLITGTVEFYLVVYNWIGMLSSKVTHKVTKLDNRWPKLEIPYTDQRFTISPVIDNIIRTQVFSPCGYENVTSRVTWKQVFAVDEPYLDPVARGYASEFSSSLVPIPLPNSSILFIQKNSLIAGQVYGFQALFKTKISDNITFTGNKTLIIDVKVVEPRAAIEGGTYQQIPLGTTSYTLNGLASNDLVTGIPDFQWTVYNHSSSSNVSLSSGATSSFVLDLSSMLPNLNLGETYTVTLRVYGAHISNATTRMAEDSIELHVVSSGAPVISISVLSGPVYSYEKLASKEKLSLHATVSDSTSVTYSWLCTSHFLDFTALNASGLLRTSLMDATLVFAKNTFTAGVTYTFRVTAYNSLTRRNSYAYQDIVVNSPPYGGSCSLNPPNGYSLTTNFEFACSGFEDEETPILYKFQEKARNQPNTEHWYFDICEFREKATYNSLLFTNPGFNTTVVEARAVIQDSLGAQVTYDLQTTVHYYEKKAGLHPQTWDSIFAREQRFLEGDVERFAMLQRAHNMYALDRLSRVEEVNWISRLQSYNSFDIKSTKITPVELLKEMTAGDYSALGATPTVLRQTVHLQKGGSGERDFAQNQYLGAMFASNSRNKSWNILLASTESTLEIAGGSNNKLTFLEDLTMVAGNLIAMSDRDQFLERGAAINDEARIESEKAKATLLHVAKDVLNFLAPGELPYEYETEYLRIVGQMFNADKVAGADIGDSLGFQAKISSSFSPPNATASVGVVVIQIPYRLFPISPNGNWTQLGVAALWIFQNNQLLSDEPLPSQFDITVPRRGFKNSSQTSENMDYDVRYFDSSIINWRKRSASAVVEGSGGNTFYAKTISTGIFSVFERPKQPTYEVLPTSYACAGTFYFPAGIIIVCCVIGMLTAKAPGEWKHSEQFWRGLNKARLLRLSSYRSKEAWEFASEWAHRRRHIWFSIFCKPTADFLTPLKRCFVLCTSLLVAMIACGFAIISFVSGGVADIMTIIMAAIVGVLVFIPTTWLLRYLFERKVPIQFRMRAYGEADIPSQSYFKWFGVCFGGCWSEIHTWKYGKTEDFHAMPNSNTNSESLARSPLEKDNFMLITGGSLDRSLVTIGGARMKDTSNTFQSGNFGGSGFNTKVSNSMNITPRQTEGSIPVVIPRLGPIQTPCRKPRLCKPRLLEPLPPRKNLNLLEKVEKPKFDKHRVTSRDLETNVSLLRTQGGRHDRMVPVNSDKSRIYKRNSEELKRYYQTEMNPKGLDEKDKAHWDTGCCGLGPEPDEVRTQGWTYQDHAAAGACALIVCGCYLGLCMLEDLKQYCWPWIYSCLVCFVAEFALHILLISMVEACILRPFASKSSLTSSKGVTKFATVVPAADEDAGDSKYDTNSKNKLRVTFKPGNNIGILYHELLVKYVITDSQAHIARIPVGARITHVNSHLVKDDSAAEKAFHFAHRSEELFEVNFSNVQNVDSQPPTIVNEKEEKSGMLADSRKLFTMTDSILNVDSTHFISPNKSPDPTEAGDRKRSHISLGVANLCEFEAKAHHIEVESSSCSESKYASGDATNRDSYIEITYPVGFKIDFACAGIIDATVQAVFDDGIASSAGVTLGMEVVSVNNVPVDTSLKFREILQEAWDAKKEITIRFLRQYINESDETSSESSD